MMKRRRQHPDDFEEIIVEFDLAAHHVGVGAEAAFPEAVADDRDDGVAWLVVGLIVNAAHPGLHVEQREVVDGGELGFHALGFLGAGQIGVDGEDAGDVFECPRLVAVVEQLGHGQADIVDAALREFAGDPHQPVRVLERQRP
jgi:hypothetical protein